MIPLIPPVAVPVRAGQVAASVLASAGQAPAPFSKLLAETTGRAGAELFGSGRAALAAWLRRAARTPRDEVLVPAYTCWSVPASVVRAGLKVRLADVSPDTLDIDPHGLDGVPFERLAAAIAAHLFAETADVAGLAGVIHARDTGIRVIEDAAQAWPRSLPSPADAVLLSFGRGKPLPLGGGGALLHSRSEQAGSPLSGRGGWCGAAKLALTSVLSRPGWYRIPEAMPFLGVGTTIYDPGFDATAPFRRWQERLGETMLQRLPELHELRTRHAQQLSERVSDCAGWSVPAGVQDKSPVRLPVLAPSRAARDQTLSALRRSGISASPIYPGTLAEIPALRPHLANPEVETPGAAVLAARLLTLPVYPTLSKRQLDRIGTAFQEVTRRLGS